MLLLLAGLAQAGPPTWEAIQQAEWEVLTTRRHDDAGEVVVYKSAVAGVPCFKGAATTDLAPAQLLEVVLDVPSAPKWSSAGVREGEILSRNGDVVDFYQYLDVPGWTFSADRFWFLRGTIGKDGDATTFVWERLENGGTHAERYREVVEANSGAVEPPINVGGWVLQPTGGRTAVSYQTCTDVGGSLPRAVQNAATQRTLPDNIGDVIREARRRAG